MNNPSPLIPQGALPEKARSRSNIRIAVFTIVAIHAVFFCGLLMQGCKRDGDRSALKNSDQTNALAPLDTNYYTNIDPLKAAQPGPGLTGAAGSQQVEPPVPPLGGQAAPNTPASGGEAREYTVRNGDSFFKIGKASGITTAAIVRANPGVNPGKLKPGQRIILPAPAPAPASVTVGVNPGKDAVGTTVPKTDPTAATHVVKSGETLSKIAKKHGTSIKEIKSANSLKTDRVNVGQKLKVPVKMAAAPTAAIESVTPGPLDGKVVTPLPTAASSAKATIK